MLTSLALWPAEQLLNQLIRSDEHLARQLLPFTGKCIEIRSRKPSLNIVMRIEADSVRLSGVDAHTLGISPDASIEGEASELLRLLLTDESIRPLANPELTISGDTEFFQQLYQCLHSLDLRWDDYLAPLLGDILTEQLQQAQKSTGNFVRDTGERMKRNVEDFLKEEVQLVPHEYAFEQFQHDLEALKLRLDRAEARAARIKTLVDSRESQ